MSALPRHRLRRAAALLLLGGVASALQGAEVVEERYPDGSPRERYEIVRDAAGEPVRHGEYRAWHENGELAAEGAYTDGVRSGRWTLRHPNGKRSALGPYRDDVREGRWLLFDEDGHKRAEGRYADGVRTGPWRFWRPDGSPDPEESGEYATVVLTWVSGAERARGETRDGARHGPWTFRWPNGRVQFEGAYFHGARDGEWRFHHADGTFDPRMLSGEYRAGRKVRDLSGTAADPGAPLPKGEAALPLTDLAGLYGLPEGSESARRAVHAYFEEAADVSTVLERRRETLPIVLGWMCALDASDPTSAERLVQLYAPALRALCHGRGFPLHPDAARGRGPHARLALLRWLSLWALTEENREFWDIDLGFPAEKTPAAELAERILFDPPFPEGPREPDEDGRGERPAVEYAGEEARAVYAARFDERPRDLAGMAVEDALRWLASHQVADGSFRSGGDTERESAHEVGVTALAVLAFLADGNTTTHGVHRDAVLRGVCWLLSQQDVSGLFRLPASSDAIYNHAIATLAICEAAAFSRSVTLHHHARRAIALIHQARNPGKAWRYGLFPNGENDTSVTVWMVQALMAARWAGLEVDAQAFAGAAAWIDEATKYGRVGYDGPGTTSARTPENEHFPRESGEAMTAAGLFARLLMGQSRSDTALERHVDLIRQRLPRWDPPALVCDMYYWYYGCHALAAYGGKHARTWRTSFLEAAIPGQAHGGELTGSWDPVGPWGFAGGRVYATAMMTLGLLAPTRLTLTGEAASPGTGGR